MNRLIGDDTTAGELFDWHRIDSPSCTQPGLSFHRGGFGCRTCGWMAVDSDKDRGTTSPHP